MTTPDNIWPEFIKDAPFTARPPITLLNEYAQKLPENTGNYVVAKVLKLNLKSDNFAYSMALSSPALGGYSYRMFDLYYPVEMYPLLLKADDAIMEELSLELLNDTKYHRVADEEELKSVLGRIFSSRKVHRIVMALIAQAKEIGLPDDEVPF